MKKLIAIFLLCATLTACTALPVQTTAPIETTEPVPVGLYDESNPVETQTAGAVRAYPLEGKAVTGMATMGGKLVLFAADEITTLRGEFCEVLATAKAENKLKTDNMTLSVSDMGIAYYAKKTKQIVLLNPQLRHSKDYDLPEDILGKPAIDWESKEVYYCTATQLRALNLETGISRLIRSFNEETMELTGTYFNGSVLSCEIGNEENTKAVFISTQTGQTLYEGVLETLATHNNIYFAVRQDGFVKQHIFGAMTDAGTAASVNIPEDAGTIVPAIAKSGVIAYQATEEGLAIAMYDCVSGTKTAQVVIDGIAEPGVWHCDEDYIWFVAGEEGSQILYRWDITKSPCEDQTSYIGPLYTYDNPDAEGLKQLQARVDAMNKTYGLRISIWEEAGKRTGDYTVLTEYQTQPITEALDELEPLLGAFPEKFLQTTVKAGWIRVPLVRSIDTGADFVQFWHGGDCYGTISVGADVKTAFLRCAAYAIDAHVMGNSRDFDTWKDLNPSGFTYGEIPEEKPYLEGEKRAFVDEESMVNPHEDRSRIIAYAMMEGNAEMFTSETMQAKLLRVCEGIREAYGLEKSTETYLWEQYLNKSLAYTK